MMTAEQQAAVATLWSLIAPFRLWAAMAVVALALNMYRADIVKAFAWAKAAWQSWRASRPVSPVVLDSTDPDIADMAALKRLKARFARLQCKEGMAAIETCGKEFFTEHQPEVQS